MMHVRDLGLKQASDESIWDFAKAHDYTIMTTDSGFAILSGNRGSPPKVVHLEECDFPLRVIEDILRRNAVRIAEFANDPEAGLLSIRVDAGLR
jgi:predicted nuclease of predicted toxin-antitoxin system